LGEVGTQGTDKEIKLGLTELANKVRKRNNQNNQKRFMRNLTKDNYASWKLEIQIGRIGNLNKIG